MHEILPAIGALLAAIAAVIANKARKHAAETNDAVNHRHEKGTPRLYDMVLSNANDARELIEWKRSYEGGPLDTGDKVVTMMEEFEAMKNNCQHGCHFKKDDDEQ